MLYSIHPQQSSNSSVLELITSGTPLESFPVASSLLVSLMYYNALALLFAVFELFVLRLIRSTFPGINSELYRILEVSIYIIVQALTFIGLTSLYYLIFVIAPTNMLLLIIPARMPLNH
ncbi:hypothetical protein BO82DRAFT_407334 [Aspergillus uvarum CBS 121591]|uniref:Uncharacterized protein n=1 Tax=Aspergillus uvarum CBS 121591 TaxID=1448315 RepID=A0A319CC77_9EURO|nr:hypothetical protein BO82DRAFT_407334 [Aspergillus uvarum CBS 121591]PYH76213.1 hypothetical protein BO82DRAFT_407334 [Aspergillus uvarum CBS 121591]